MKCAEAEKLVKKMAQDLAEHFDAVLILTTWEEEGATRWAYLGSGNELTRMGMARDYITNSDQHDLADRLAKAMSDKEDWGEDDD